MPNPLIPKKFGINDPLSLRYTRQEIEEHSGFDTLFKAALGKLKKFTQVMSDFVITKPVDAKLLFHIANVLLSPEIFVSTRLEKLAVLINKLPTILLNLPLSYIELEKLGRHGVKLDYQEQGTNLLHMTLLAGDESFKQFQMLLVSAKADINAPGYKGADSGGTALHGFIANENFTVASNIISQFGYLLDLSVVDGELKTLIILAAKMGADRIAAQLCRLDKATPLVINMQDADGRTALHYACMFKLSDTMHVLRDKGAILIADASGKTAEDYLLNTPSQLIIDVLRSVEIHAGRDENASSNRLHAELSDANDREILATKENAIKWRNDYLKRLYHNDEEAKELIRNLASLCRKFSGKSLLQAIEARANLVMTGCQNPQPEPHQSMAHVLSRVGQFKVERKQERALSIPIEDNWATAGNSNPP